MKALWTEDEARFEGERHNLDSSWAWPKPVHEPHPPLVMGAAPGPKTLEHVVEYCDAGSPLLPVTDIAGQIEKVRTAVAYAGRDLAEFDVTAYSAKTHQIEALADAGVDCAIFSLPPLGPEAVIPKLDEWEEEPGPS